MKASLEDYQKTLAENESKYKSEIARLKNRCHELQFAFEEAQKESLGGTPSRMLLPASSQAASCNGDFLSEGGSLVSKFLKKHYIINPLMSPLRGTGHFRNSGKV